VISGYTRVDQKVMHSLATLSYNYDMTIAKLLPLWIPHDSSGVGLRSQCVPHALRSRKAGCCNVAEPRFDADGLNFLYGLLLLMKLELEALSHS